MCSRLDIDTGRYILARPETAPFHPQRAAKKELSIITPSLNYSKLNRPKTSQLLQSQHPALGMSLVEIFQRLSNPAISPTPDKNQALAHVFSTTGHIIIDNGKSLICSPRDIYAPVQFIYPLHAQPDRRSTVMDVLVPALMRTSQGGPFPCVVFPHGNWDGKR
jgi:hypothetical protein